MSGLNPEIEELLEKYLQSLQISEYALNVEDNNAKGDNYLGLIRKITVTGKKNGTNDFAQKWIAKCAPQVQSYREMTNVDLAYEREKYVYEELLPILDKFQKDRFVIEPFKSYPTHIISYFEPYKETIVLEDMKDSGFVMKDRREILDIDHVKLVMQAYAKLHAISYAMKDQDPVLFEDIKRKTEDKFFAAMEEVGQQEYDDNLNAKALKAFDVERNCREIEIFRNYSKRSARVMQDVLKKAYEDEYSVVCHGDSWITNMLFKYTNSETVSKPRAVCLLDFQLTRFGSPAFDLSYFLFTCTDKSFRDKHYDQMISTYYYSLCAHLADLGSDPEKMIPFSVLKEHLKKYSIFGYALSKSILFLMLCDSEELPDVKEGDNASDNSNIFLFETKDDSLYYHRIKGVIEDFVAKGYFDFIEKDYEN